LKARKRDEERNDLGLGKREKKRGRKYREEPAKQESPKSKSSKKGKKTRRRLND